MGTSYISHPEIFKILNSILSIFDGIIKKSTWGSYQLPDFPAKFSRLTLIFLYVIYFKLGTICRIILNMGFRVFNVLFSTNTFVPLDFALDDLKISLIFSRPPKSKKAAHPD
jgi:hypothetical protein